jgi:hypothetical protein
MYAFDTEKLYDYLPNKKCQKQSIVLGKSGTSGANLSLESHEHICGLFII